MNIYQIVEYCYNQLAIHMVFLIQFGINLHL